MKMRKINKNLYFYIKCLTSIPFGGPIVKQYLQIHATLFRHKYILCMQSTQCLARVILPRDIFPPTPRKEFLQFHMDIEVQ